MGAALSESPSVHSMRLDSRMDFALLCVDVRSFVTRRTIKVSRSKLVGTSSRHYSCRHLLDSSRRYCFNFAHFVHQFPRTLRITSKGVRHEALLKNSVSILTDTGESS